MKPTELSFLMQEIYPTRVPMIVDGPPGIGKSGIIKQVGEKIGKFLDIRALLHDPSDLKFPIVNLATESVKWVNSIFPKDPDWKGVIALEELDKCPPMMQGALLQLFWDRKLGDYTLPEGCWIVAAGNRQKDRAGSHRLITPLGGRAIQIELEVSFDDWQAWALGAGIVSDVRHFLHFKPGALFDFEPEAKCSATPRTWERVSSILPFVGPSRIMETVAGLIGEGHAVELVAFMRTRHEIEPLLDGILKTPGTATIPSGKPDILYALVGALGEKSKGLPDLDGLATYGQRLPGEFSALLLKDVFAANTKKVDGQVKGDPKLFARKGNMAAWIAKHRDVIIGN